jgi:hypothetical protein
MFCPNCGASTSREQKYCRACGLRLEKIADALAEQLPLPGTSDLKERQHRIERLGLTLLGVMAAIIFAFAIGYGVIHEMIIKEGRLVPGIFLLLFFTTAATAISLLVWSRKLAGDRAKGEKARSTAIPGPDTSRSLSSPPAASFVSTVTEGTTEFLEGRRDADPVLAAHETKTEHQP